MCLYFPNKFFNYSFRVNCMDVCICISVGIAARVKITEKERGYIECFPLQYFNGLIL